MKIPLSYCNSAEQSFVCSGYPYGFKQRTTIRFWLEKNNKKGFRFCSQTLRPKTGYWNKEKKSTYSPLCASLYLEDGNVCKWEGLSEYSSPAQILTFVEFYPQADYSLLIPFVAMTLSFEKKVLASGFSGSTINGEKRELSNFEKEQAEKDIQTLERALVILLKH
jgi:hypothetical protein